MAAQEAGVAVFANRVGSMFTWFFTPDPVTDWTSAAKSDTKAFGRFFRAMLDNGVYLPPSQFEAAFLSTAHTEEDIQTHHRGREAGVCAGHARAVSNRRPPVAAMLSLGRHSACASSSFLESSETHTLPPYSG